MSTSCPNQGRNAMCWVGWLLVAFFCVLSDAVDAEIPTTNANPYTSGCLYGGMPGWDRMRVCNSNDKKEDIGVICREPDIMHNEIRVLAANWGSSYFESWVIQIILSELLDVPVTIETGDPDVSIASSFYDPQGLYEFVGSMYRLGPDGLNNGVKYDQDCTKADRSHGPNYEVCHHLIPEAWTIQRDWIIEMSQDGRIHGPQFMGVVGYEGIFVPKYTAEQEPSILSYFGMMGDQNRRKLAELFPRPVTWGHYCNEISNTSCTSPDETAQRPPEDDDEAEQFFSEGNFQGKFVYTEENDCDKWPQDCTGHSTPFACGWDSFAEGLFFWLDISLKGGGPHNNTGYSYGRQVEILQAACATKSNIILEWWTPSYQSEILRGGPCELVKVSFPSPTQVCKEHKSSPADLCSADQSVRVGSELGACDEGAIALQKMISGGLFYTTMEEDEAIRSPGYQFLERFSMTELHLAQIFQKISTNFTERDSVCSFVVDGYEKFAKPLLPRSHPRSLQETSQRTFSIACIVLGAIAVVSVVITGFFVYQKREHRAIQYAQIEFLSMLLFGSFCLSIGATIMGVKPTDASCVAEVWMINIGYTLILVPLVIKVAAINRLMQFSQKMRRVSIPRKTLVGATLMVSASILIYLTVWTAVDPPRKTPEYELTDTQSAKDGSTIVLVSYYCSSRSVVWRYASAGWNTLLLLCATILAFQTRNVRQEFNESLVLTAMIYSGFAIVLLRVVSLAIADAMSAETMGKFRSVLFSVDVMLTLVIYFVPKILADALHLPAGSGSQRSLYDKNKDDNSDILARSMRGFDIKSLQKSGLEIGDTKKPNDAESGVWASSIQSDLESVVNLEEEKSVEDGEEATGDAANEAESTDKKRAAAISYIVAHSLYPEQSREVLMRLLDEEREELTRLLDEERSNAEESEQSQAGLTRLLDEARSNAEGPKQSRQVLARPLDEEENNAEEEEQ